MSELEVNKLSLRSLGPLLWFSALYLLVAVVILPLLPFGGSSEAREAKVIDVIVTTGEWVLPLRNGVVPSKPPLFHWIGAGLALPSGFVSEFDARLPSVLMGLASLWLVGFAVFRFVAHSSSHLLRQHAFACGLVSCGILSLTYGFYQMSTMAMVDMVFTFFVWAALAALSTSSGEQWREDRSLSPVARALFWTACAGAVVARGPIGIVLPVFLAGVAGVVLAGVRVTVLQIVRPSIGWIAFLLPAAWYYAAISRGGEAFVDRQILFENVRRIVGGEHMNNQPVWFYLPSLLRTTFPWCLLLLLLIWKRPGGEPNVGRPILSGRFSLSERFLPLIAFGAGVLLFSIPSGKRHSYMLPLYPLIAIQVAVLAVELFVRGETKAREGLARTIQVVRPIVLCGAVVVAGGLGFVAQSPMLSQPIMLGLRPYLLSVAFPVAAILLIGLWPLYFITRETPLPKALTRTWHGLFMLVAVVVCAGLGIKSSLKDYPGLARRIAALVPPGASLAVVKDPFEEYFDPVLFYLRRDVTLVDVNRVDLPCAEGTIYLARTHVLHAALARFPGRITEISALREFGDEINNSRSREVIAFTCDPLSSNSVVTQHQGMT